MLLLSLLLFWLLALFLPLAPRPRERGISESMNGFSSDSESDPELELESESEPELVNVKVTGTSFFVTMDGLRLVTPVVVSSSPMTEVRSFLNSEWKLLSSRIWLLISVSFLLL